MKPRLWPKSVFPSSLSVFEMSCSFPRHGGTEGFWWRRHNEKVDGNLATRLKQQKFAVYSSATRPSADYAPSGVYVRVCVWHYSTEQWHFSDVVVGNITFCGFCLFGCVTNYMSLLTFVHTAVFYICSSVGRSIAYCVMSSVAQRRPFRPLPLQVFDPFPSTFHFLFCLLVFCLPHPTYPFHTTIPFSAREPAPKSW